MVSLWPISRAFILNNFACFLCLINKKRKLYLILKKVKPVTLVTGFTFLIPFLCKDNRCIFLLKIKLKK